MKALHIINNLEVGGAERLLVDSLALYAKHEEISVIDLALLNGKQTDFSIQLEKQFTGKIIRLGNGSLYSPFLIHKISKLLNKYDIIHAHLFPTLYSVAIAKWLKGKKAKLIFTEHSTSNRRMNSRLWRKIDRMIYDQYDCITAISTAVSQALINIGISKNKVVTIPNGIVLEKYERSELTDRKLIIEDKDAFILMQVSRFHPYKDQGTVIRALKFLPDTVHAVFVGNGDLLDNCKELAKELNIQNRVHFMGIRTDIPELLGGSDVIVQSSNQEGFGLAALEGMAAGKPVVASDIPGLSEIVIGAGLTFQAGDEKQLAEKIELLIHDPSFYKKISVSCLTRSKEFNINRMVQRIVSLYKQII